MKNLLVATLLACFLSGCMRDKAEDALQGAYSAIYGSPLDLPQVGNRLSLKLVGLTDTRCPVNVVCIQNGWVDLLFRISDSTDTVKVPVVFHPSKNKNQDQEFKLGNTPYALRVYDVQPYPQKDYKPRLEEYKISLTLRRR